MGKLNTFVHVVEVDDKGAQTGNAGTFGPDDTVPEWAATAITNPDVWESRDSDTSAGGVDGGQPDHGLERPRGNASRDAWAEYAGKLDPPVTVSDDMDRAAIIAAVDAK